MFSSPLPLAYLHSASQLQTQTKPSRRQKHQWHGRWWSVILWHVLFTVYCFIHHGFVLTVHCWLGCSEILSLSVRGQERRGEEKAEPKVGGDLQTCLRRGGRTNFNIRSIRLDVIMSTTEVNFTTRAGKHHSCSSNNFEQLLAWSWDCLAL